MKGCDKSKIPLDELEAVDKLVDKSVEGQSMLVHRELVPWPSGPTQLIIELNFASLICT